MECRLCCRLRGHPSFSLSSFWRTVRLILFLSFLFDTGCKFGLLVVCSWTKFALLVDITFSLDGISLFSRFHVPLLTMEIRFLSLFTRLQLVSHFLSLFIGWKSILLLFLTCYWVEILCPSPPYCAKVRLKCALTLLHHPEVRGGSSLLSPFLTCFSHPCFSFFNPSLGKRSFCSFPPLLGGNSFQKFVLHLFFFLLSTRRNCPLGWVDIRLILIFLVTRRNFHFGSLLPEGMEIRLCAFP